MTKSEALKLIDEVADEVLSVNKANIPQSMFPDAIELSVRLSCLTTIRLLQKLGVLEEFTLESE